MAGPPVHIPHNETAGSRESLWLRKAAPRRQRLRRGQERATWGQREKRNLKGENAGWCRLGCKQEDLGLDLKWEFPSCGHAWKAQHEIKQPDKEMTRAWSHRLFRGPDWPLLPIGRLPIANTQSAQSSEATERLSASGQRVTARQVLLVPHDISLAPRSLSSGRVSRTGTG